MLDISPEADLDTLFRPLENSRTSDFILEKEKARLKRTIRHTSWLRYSQKIAMQMLDKMEQTGMTQQQLAQKMGCSQQYVSKILKGKENLSLETLFKIENSLGIRILSTENIPA